MKTKINILLSIFLLCFSSLPYYYNIKTLEIMYEVSVFIYTLEQVFALIIVFWTKDMGTIQKIFELKIVSKFTIFMFILFMASFSFHYNNIITTIMLIISGMTLSIYKDIINKHKMGATWDQI